VRQLAVALAAIGAAAIFAARSPASPGRSTAAWNRPAAEAYLERRAAWWLSWRGAARDHGTVCVSCHTTLLYVLARSALGDADSPTERRIVDSVTARVRQWDDIAPYYANRSGDDRKAIESRGTESVLNALILADRDSRAGVLGANTRAAFDRMWSMQTADGGWAWLRFDLDPWEGRDSAFFGAALAARAVAVAPPAYAVEAAVGPRVERLRSFLASAYPAQPLANRAALLWAAGSMPDLIDADRRSETIADLVSAQRRDGGWSLEELMSDSLRTSLRAWFSPSDGYATGLAASALLPTDAHDSAQRGVAWLARHQESTTGSWPARSLNAKRDPASDPAKFMTDAATAFAMLALAAGESGEVGRAVVGKKTRVAVDHLHVQLAILQRPGVARQRQR